MVHQILRNRLGLLTIPLIFGTGVWQIREFKLNTVAHAHTSLIAVDTSTPQVYPALPTLMPEITVNTSTQHKSSISSDVIREMDAYLQAHHDIGWFAGSAIISRGGDLLFAGGYGMSNVEHRVANTPQTRFRIGSISKQFTAAAILQLQDRGLINVEASVSTYLPDYPNGESITLHHLLTHTSGIPNMTSFPDYTEWMRLVTTLDDIVARFRELPLEFAPGESYAYSNSGYVLLSQVIEAVSGQTYADYLEEQVLKPLGLEHTGYERRLAVINGLAEGYQLTESGYQSAEYINMDVPQGAGGLYSTVEDLAQWNQILFGQRMPQTILSEEAIELMTTPHVSMGIEDMPHLFYGYGFVVNDRPDRPHIGHDGGINGFVSSLAYLPKEEVTIAVLSNVQDANPGQLSKDLVAILLGKPYELPSLPDSITLDPALYERYVGTYQLTPDFQISVTVENDQLKIQGTGRSPVTLYPISETEYFSRIINNLRIIFNLATDGTVESISLMEGEVETVATKID
ncbi:MAG: serine hydrolase [Cyanobacteria bacterium J06633_2]